MKQYSGAIPRSEMLLPPTATVAERIRDEIRMARVVPFATIIGTELGRYYGGSVLGRSWKQLSAEYLTRKVRAVAAYELSTERVEEAAAPFRLGGFLAMHVMLVEQPSGTRQAVLGQTIMRKTVLRKFSQATDEQTLTNFDIMLERVHGRLPEDVRAQVYLAGTRAAIKDSEDSNSEERANPNYVREFGHGYGLAATNLIRLIATHADAPYHPITRSG